MREGLKIPVVLLCGVVAGCTSSSSNYLGEITKTEETRLFVCHGFDCSYKTRVDLGAADHRQYASYFAEVGSAEAERVAVGKAVQHAEERAAGVIGIRDLPKSDYTQSRVKGQMDCIDESTNTRSLLLYLEKRGLLKHHAVEANRSRGLFVDGRYPHSTAVLRETGSGRRWAIDSWYEPAGGPPDIRPYDDWVARGRFGER
jgi:hypothetical protein